MLLILSALLLATADAAFILHAAVDAAVTSPLMLLRLIRYATPLITCLIYAMPRADTPDMPPRQPYVTDTTV